MRRDSIFYKLFQQSPTLLFELLPEPPANAQAYRFDSVAVKEPRFEIDGVFLPPEGETGTVYFCEVQFQKDELLYERVFAESALYFYRNRARFSDWQAIVIYPTRRIEQGDVYPHRTLLSGDQVRRVYLDELGEIRTLPLWVAVMVLTTVEEDRAPAEARYLLTRTRQEVSEPASRAIIELITTILAYRFETLTRVEVEAMLNITFQETRLYQDLKQEAREEAREEGREEGLQRERSLILRLLTRRVGELPEAVVSQVEALSLEQLEELGEALLDFTSLDDAQAWLGRNGREAGL
ncbi:MAG: Rpn family recombination-promoting nuclease/putative transposase [Microcoleus sp. SIO2G3]|nr:Rpn family recombination-promoting nuclease/putative transposase [Microcoleus sp. SIO2G3]